MGPLVSVSNALCGPGLNVKLGVKLFFLLDEVQKSLT